MEKRKLLEEMPQEKPKETENLREEVRPTSKKTKFGRKPTEDEESSCGSNEEMDLKTILIYTFLVSLKCSTISLTVPYIFQVKREGGKLSRGRERTFSRRGKAQSDCDYH